MKRVAIKRGEEYLASHYITENQVDAIRYNWDKIPKDNYYSQFMDREEFMKCGYLEGRVILSITEDLFALMQPHNFMVGKQEAKELYYNSISFIKIDIGD